MTDTFVYKSIHTFSRRRPMRRLNRKCRFIGKLKDNNPASDGAEIAPNVVHYEIVRRAKL